MQESLLGNKDNKALEMESDYSPAARSQKADSKVHVNVSSAEFRVVPRTVKEWLTFQLLSINVTNVALLITVVILTSSVGSTLNDLREENAKASQTLNALKDLRPLVEKTVDNCKMCASQYTLFNDTLQEAVADGLPKLVNLSDTVSSVANQALSTEQNLQFATTKLDIFSSRVIVVERQLSSKQSVLFTPATADGSKQILPRPVNNEGYAIILPLTVRNPSDGSTAAISLDSTNTIIAITANDTRIVARLSACVAVVSINGAPPTGQRVMFAWFNFDTNRRFGTGGYTYTAQQTEANYSTPSPVALGSITVEPHTQVHLQLRVFLANDTGNTWVVKQGADASPPFSYGAETWALVEM